MKIKRFATNPLIHAQLQGLPLQKPISINGASVIRAPDWLHDSPGKFLMYFAHHHGSSIRLAFADTLQGPWQMYEGGTLHLKDTACSHHIASPDVHVDHESKEILMYFHGPRPDSREALGLTSESQVTMLAASKDGLHFKACEEVLGHFYFRVFSYDGYTYAIAKNQNKGGILYRSLSGRKDFEAGPEIIPRMRHCAVLLKQSVLHLFFSRLLDAPETIYMTTIDLTQDWLSWKPQTATRVLKPECDYEGAHLPVQKSLPGMPSEPVNEVRDPYVIEESGRYFLFYSIAGEQGIAGAEVLL